MTDKDAFVLAVSSIITVRGLRGDCSLEFVGQTIASAHKQDWDGQDIGEAANAFVDHQFGYHTKQSGDLHARLPCTITCPCSAEYAEKLRTTRSRAAFNSQFDDY